MKHPTVEASNVATHMSVILPTTMGLDLSDRVSTYHVLRGDGLTVMTAKVPTDRDALRSLFTSKPSDLRLPRVMGRIGTWSGLRRIAALRLWRLPTRPFNRFTACFGALLHRVPVG